MKKLLLCFVLGANVCCGQNQELQFNTEYYDAVDKWVAFDKKEEDTAYVLGFIYIDQQAGFTFDYESKFKVTPNGLVKLPRAFESSLKSRLSENTANVTVFTDEQVKQLNLPKEPEWLKHYKTDADKASYLVPIGYFYNHVGASHNAIEPLLKAYYKEPHFKGLEFELAYAYNATRNYNKAIDVLKKAIENDPKNFWYYREWGFALKELNKLPEAETVYLKGIGMTTDNAQKAEMAINMTQSYFKIKNRAKFDEWTGITRKYAEAGSQFTEFLEHLEKNWDKK